MLSLTRSSPVPGMGTASSRFATLYLSRRRQPKASDGRWHFQHTKPRIESALIDLSAHPCGKTVKVRSLWVAEDSLKVWTSGIDSAQVSV